MKPENAIEVKDVVKKFKIYFDKGHTLKEKTLFRGRRKYEERKVLNGISFEVMRKKYDAKTINKNYVSGQRTDRDVRTCFQSD